MKILVCVKQVIDPSSPLGINDGGCGIAAGKHLSYRMNRFDEYALEEAVRIKEKYAGTTVHALTVGPQRAHAVVKKALEKGAQHGVHILCDDTLQRPPSTIAHLIAGYARDKEYDLILTGVMSEDGMHCATGPYLAALLGVPCAVSVIKTQLDEGAGAIAVSCELEAGMSEEVRLSLPCALTIQTGINRPRYPSLSNVLRAQEQELETVDAAQLGVPPADEKSCGLSYPRDSEQGVILQGTREEQARRLLSILHEKSLI